MLNWFKKNVNIIYLSYIGVIFVLVGLALIIIEGNSQIIDPNIWGIITGGAILPIGAYAFFNKHAKSKLIASGIFLIALSEISKIIFYYIFKASNSTNPGYNYLFVIGAFVLFNIYLLMKYKFKTFDLIIGIPFLLVDYILLTYIGTEGHFTWVNTDAIIASIYVPLLTTIALFTLWRASIPLLKKQDWCLFAGLLLYVIAALMTAGYSVAGLPATGLQGFYNLLLLWIVFIAGIACISIGKKSPISLSAYIKEEPEVIVTHHQQPSKSETSSSENTKKIHTGFTQKVNLTKKIVIKPETATKKVAIATNTKKLPTVKIIPTKEKDYHAKHVFNQPVIPSDKISHLVGVEQTTRAVVVEKIWDYIHKHNLQDKNNKKKIHIDEQLSVFIPDRTIISMLELPKYMFRQLFPAAKVITKGDERKVIKLKDEE